MKLKICGMQRQQDIDVAYKSGFHFCGFIFHPESPRYMEPQKAGCLLTYSMRRVGVFVNQNIIDILEIMKVAKLDYAQFHGRQTREDAKKIGNDKIIKVLWPEKYNTCEEFFEECDKWKDFCAYFLIDSGKCGGGSGKQIACNFFKDISLPKPWLLAGGLNINNISQILANNNPWGLDVNSGLEISPGCKSKELIQNFAALCVRR